jgi:hypothetical protein
MLFIVAVLAIVMTGGFASYKFVQAKMHETSSFSDSYILQKAGKHFPLPDGAPLSLVRVEDAKKLSEENPFYANVKEGDYIIAYAKLFVIYDAVHDEIKAVKESNKGKE